MSFVSNKNVLNQVGKEASGVLSKIHEQCFPNYWNIDAFNDFFSVEGTQALLAGEPTIGMMVYRTHFEQADIITIAVLAEHRRKGLARIMLDKALADMQINGVQAIFLDVEDGNLAAIALYEGLGFSVVRRRRQYYRQKDGTCTDALVMSKKFS